MGEDSLLAHLHEVIDHAAHLLPAQGPITVFVHHNTLHAFEHLPFEEAVKKGGQVFGCQPYLSEDRYRAELARGRIRFAELQQVLEEDLGPQAHETILGLGTRLELRLAMLQYPLRSGPTEELLWFVAETDALRRIRPEASAVVRGQLIAETRRWIMRDFRGGNEAIGDGSTKKKYRRLPADLKGLFERSNESAVENWGDEEWESFTLRALWRVCRDGVRDVPAFSPPPPMPLRHRDLLLEATGADTDPLVNEVLIRLCAAFLDQGFAHWQLPQRQRGLYRAFCTMYRQPGGPPDLWLRGLAREAARLEDGQIGALASAHESLTLLGVATHEWEDYLSATLLALRGWGGMVHQVELRGDRVAHPVPAGSLVDLLAVRLLLERFALAHVAREALRYQGPLNGLRHEARKHMAEHRPPSIEQRAFLLFQLAQILGLSPDLLYRLSKLEWMTLIEEIEVFSGVERRRLFHLAYERRFYTRALDAIALHAPRTRTPPGRPRFQAVFCLDEREESFRRHLEEIAPDAETLAAAGFYNVPMYYRGAADAHFVPLCPVVIRPQHWVTEQVVEELEPTHRRRARTRRLLGQATHQIHLGSRGVILGALVASTVGVLASIPLVGRILFPRLTARLQKVFGRIIRTPPRTRLQLERSEPAPGPENGHVGWTVDEMANNGERLLRDLGLTSGLARLVLLFGHGSNSLNNPHNSAYNCGACSGAMGGPNARAMAHLLNDPRVRERLARRGLAVPAGTVFVGGYHDTCRDAITFFDVERVPASHRQEFEAARKDIAATCARNAHERCRRFMSAPLTMSFAAAHQHVEERSEDLAQTRPECGHATNALSIVGRREWTRGLYLDRRAFLTSYDPAQDDADSTILTRLLQAVFPVCAGINLEYYFSYVDNTGFGCGTKLPHNLAALLGVMNGAADDLRTGLPWQMVEIHEPVRLLNIIETTPEAMLQIMERNEGIGRLCRNGWVHVAVLHPETMRLSVYKDGKFEEYEPQATHLPKAASSVDWYRGWRDHLEFAEIEG
jgi:uncharacterized protein YbcC (UPF0753/DUF2309 family)